MSQDNLKFSRPVIDQRQHNVFMTTRAHGKRKREDYVEETWKRVYLVGTELEALDVSKIVDWDFGHLDEALFSGDLKEAARLYIFGTTERLILLIS